VGEVLSAELEEEDGRHTEADHPEDHGLQDGGRHAVDHTPNVDMALARLQ
jgi:hypothetical protein